MKRILILVASYMLVFVLGYLGLGITLHYLKPEVKMLPTFVEQLLDGPQKWDVQSIAVQDVGNIKYHLINDENHDPKEEIIFTDDYNSEKGIFCFRGNAQRNAPTRGVLEKRPTGFHLDWKFETEYDNRPTEFGTWGGGSGWTGQPLVIQWPDQEKRKLHAVSNDFLAKNNGKEVVVGSLCGNIYFIDWETGEATRPHLSIHNPIKGTVSVDPRMNGLLYVGQGIPNGDRFGTYVFNMFTGQEILYRSGLDPSARRQWGAFDSNSLIDPKTGYWFHPAENGQIYKTKVVGPEAIKAPVKFNYGINVHPSLGLEASMGAWNNLGFFADNGGNVFCLDLMSLEPLWYLDNFDDTDASLVLDLQENNHPYLYVGNEVDKQGEEGFAHIRKIDALTGRPMWDVLRKCAGTSLAGKVNSGGVLASVLTGKKKASNLVYGIFSRVNGGLGGEFVAIDKKTGKEVFSIPMEHYSWSSPIDIYDKAGNCYIFFSDVYGNLYLIDGLTGDIIQKQKTDGVYESSPIAWGNRIVMGGRGRFIYSFIID